MSKRVPKKARVPLEDQIATIMKLLTVWPSAPYDAIEKFVKDTTGSTSTRVCIQKAKEELGLHQPEHEELTIKKMQYAKLVAIGLMQHQGIGGLNLPSLISKVAKALRDRFFQNTNHHLVTMWVEDAQAEVTKSEFKYDKILKRIRRDLKKLGVLEEDRQQTLLG